MPRIMRHHAASVLLAVAFAGGPVETLSAEEPKQNEPAKGIRDRIAGTWLFDEAGLGRVNYLVTVWSSTLTIAGDSFRLHGFMGMEKDLTGTFQFAADKPNAIDLKIQEFDLAPAGTKKIGPDTIPAIFSLEGDRLTLCFPRRFNDPRPAAIAESPAFYKLVLQRPPAGFKAVPKQVAVTVRGSDGKPVEGAIVAAAMESSGGAIQYIRSSKTGKNGVVTLKHVDCAPGLIVRDEAQKRIAVIDTSPVRLALGELTATLEPECRVAGTLTSDELEKLHLQMGAANVSVYHNNRVVLFCDTRDRTFEFPLPPGKYRIGVRGENTSDTSLQLEVPAGGAGQTLAPINMPAAVLARLQGKPAPELNGIVGWKGKPAKLSELKGNYVLLEFWGYWCGPCIRTMPVLFELHEKYGDKGLKIVGIHMDLEDGIDSAAKLDAKIKRVQAEIWKGKEIPFPTALVSGARGGEKQLPGGPIAEYGVEGFPTTILIDREGKVVGRFDAYRAAEAIAEVEQLLGKK